MRMLPEDEDSSRTPPRLPPGEDRLTGIDLMRVLVFTFVISAHVVTSTLDEEQLPVAVWGMLMHFSRYAFVFVSAFVLCHSSRNRALPPTQFWRKRFAAVVLPYLLWTLIYYGLETGIHGWPGLLPWLHLLLLHVVWGTEWYHLYFLLVTIQLYLVFPVLRWLVDRCHRAHGWLIGGAALIQLGYMALISFVPAPPAPWLIIWEHAEIMVPLYALFAVGGAVAARRRDQLDDWLSRHPVRLGGLGLLGLSICAGIFAVRAGNGSAWTAAAAGFPSVLPWAVGATMIIYAVATAAARRFGSDDLLPRLARAGALRAFGVFAIHPLILWVIEVTLLPALTDLMPGPFSRTVIIFLLTVAGALATVKLLLRTPLSRLLLARQRIPPSRAASARLGDPLLTGWATRRPRSRSGRRSRRSTG